MRRPGLLSAPSGSGLGRVLVGMARSRERRGEMRTGAVRRMLVDLPAQLGHIFPAAGAAGVVQLLQVPDCLFTLGVLRCGERPAGQGINEDDVGEGSYPPPLC